MHTSSAVCQFTAPPWLHPARPDHAGLLLAFHSHVVQGLYVRRSESLYSASQKRFNYKQLKWLARSKPGGYTKEYLARLRYREMADVMREQWEKAHEKQFAWMIVSSMAIPDMIPCECVWFTLLSHRRPLCDHS